MRGAREIEYDTSILMPEQRLAFAVLVRGIRDLEYTATESWYYNNRIEEQERIRESARRWVYSDTTSYIYAFVSICDILGLDPWWVRKKIEEKEVQEGMLTLKQWLSHQNKSKFGVAMRKRIVAGEIPAQNTPEEWLKLYTDWEAEKPGLQSYTVCETEGVVKKN